MLKDLFRWIVILTLFSSGIIKLISPATYLPYFSSLPIVSEPILIIAAIPLSISEILISLLLLFNVRVELIYKILSISFLGLTVWSISVISLDVEIPNACLDRMASRQSFFTLISKNIGLCISSFYLYMTNKNNN